MHMNGVIWLLAIVVLIVSIIIQYKALNRIAFSRSLFITGMAFLTSFIVTLTHFSLTAVWVLFIFFQTAGWLFLVLMTYKSWRRLRSARLRSKK